MKITAVEHISGYRLKVTFNNGKSKTIDFGRFIRTSTHPLIKKYRNSELFKQVYLDEFGGLCWGDNEFDISPESIIRGDFDVIPSKSKSV